MSNEVDSINPERRTRKSALPGRALILAGLLAGSLALSPASAAVQAARSASPVTVTVWDIQQGVQQKEAQAQAAAFNKANPGIKVQYEFFQNDPYKTKLSIAIGAHQGPDVFMGWGGGILKTYVDAGAVADLTAAFNGDAAWKSRYTPSVLGPVTFGGHIYGVPYNATTPEVIFYNKDIFKQYNLSVPTTWPQLEQVIKTLQSHNLIPFALDGKSEWPEMMILQYLADRIGGSSALNNIALRKAGASFNSPAWIKAFTQAQALVKENAFENGFASFNYDTNDGGQLFYSGRAAMMFMGVWQIGNAQTNAPKFLPKMGFFPVPAVPGGKGNVNDIVGVPANYYSLSATSKNQAAAIAFLKNQLNPGYASWVLSQGQVPPVQSLDTGKVTDPLVKAQVALLAKAPSYQLALDQLLPPQLAQSFLDLTGSLFALSITPQQFATQMQAKTAAYFAAHH
jgi:raffinose/stachyose/melibiose transport system substrate-binding protein